ncbi:MAG: DUF1697 domain-containing protein [Actinomycetota bacterium]|nr:DUF1697 domain-containing protein [Actinomycetota bacterium]
MAVWVSMLRGINLGARNRVPMPALRDALVAADFEDVQTYVQSGNIITSSGHRSRDKVAALVREVVATNFYVDVPVVVRSPAELTSVLAWNPFPDAAAERPKLVQVTHLVTTPAPGDVEILLSAVENMRERIAVRGPEVAVDYVEGIQTSKVQGAWLAKRLGGVDGTARNWRTLTALCELTADV